MLYAYTPPIPPATVAYDAAAYAMRQAHTYVRRRFMEGGWEPLLAVTLRVLLTDEAVEAMRCVDYSHNIYRDTVRRLAVRYQDPPSVREGELGDAEVPILFSAHPSVEEAALAYNVAVASLRVVDGELVVDVLPPDHVDVCWDTAGRVTGVRLARPLNTLTNGAAQYVVEEWDLPARAHRVYGPSGWQEQPAYPWVYADGTPFAPVVLFRASRGPDWWGANRWPELVEATLEEGVAWTAHRYGRLNGSSAIPYVVDTEVAGRTPDDADGGTNQVNAGPWTVLQLQSRSGRTGSVGVLQATFDPEKDVAAIQAAYNARMEALGIGDSALQRRGAESGYAIVVRREGLLRLRKSTEPMFRAADQEFVRKAVACLRLFGGGPAESPKYRVEYAALSGGSAEDEERRAQEKHDLDIGVATPASILADREGIALEEARGKLARILAAGPVSEVGAQGADVGNFHPTLVQAPRAERAGAPPYEGFVDFQGLRIDVENRAGSTRSGFNQDGTPWTVTMGHDYGEVRGTRGTDGDKLDVYVGPNHDSGLVVVVRQHVPLEDGSAGPYDEDKVMLGFDSAEEAVAAYQEQYDRPGFYKEGDYVTMPFGQFWRIVKNRQFHGKRIDPGAAVPRSTT